MPWLNRADPVIMGHNLAEHRELFTRLQALRATLAAAAPITAERVASLRVGLLELREHLRAHFEQEEHGGFMEESIARIPRLAVAAAGIVRQHPTLLGELDALVERLAQGDVSAATWARAGGDFEEFAAALAEHERQETAVVQEGFNEDLGLS